MATNMLQPGIFLHPRPKKSVLPPPNKKRRIEHKIAEIHFDDTKREDYLTGFHKRKVQRTKRAQEENEKKMREEKRDMRKQLRDERKQELEEHVEAINRALREVEPIRLGFDDSDEEVWGGILDDEKEILPDLVDHEEEYIDEDKYTTVTVEAVNISKKGLQRVRDEDHDIEDAKNEKKWKQKEKDEKEGEKGKKQWPKREKKPKFRYESKVERKATRAKQKAGNKARADARKDK